MAEALTSLTRLLIVRDIEEDASGAVLRFQGGGHGRLALREANFDSHLLLALRSQERQHPVGVNFGERQVIVELVRADNDVPTQLWEEPPGCARILFQGHDGVFCLKPDHPESERIRTLLREAIQQKARVWFSALRPDLALLDVVPAGWMVAVSHSNSGGNSIARDGPVII